MRESRSGGAMGRTEQGDRVAEAQESIGIEWAECDDVSVQPDAGSLRPAWPKEWARRANVEAYTDVTPVVHTPTGAVVFLPPSVSLNDFLEVAGV